ncbi:hypothetical protein PtA15_16A301 [Puccinia triticina]|uniref:RING-type domain-containing protein n=1 Tax=Puccinia triticina TaxID=208348 RepID=A0ABY7D450_9BASI|nr:uncharacterized protein PtA15_16A301 [Puccinia triticina]WAQ92393.1 hypothetical protein PtA15_16A301 [Puccinia triticina]
MRRFDLGLARAGALRTTLYMSGVHAPGRVRPTDVEDSWADSSQLFPIVTKSKILNVTIRLAMKLFVFSLVFHVHLLVALPPGRYPEGYLERGGNLIEDIHDSSDLQQAIGIPNGEGAVRRFPGARLYERTRHRLSRPDPRRPVAEEAANEVYMEELRRASAWYEGRAEQQGILEHWIDNEHLLDLYRRAQALEARKTLDLDRIFEFLGYLPKEDYPHVQPDEPGGNTFSLRRFNHDSPNDKTANDHSGSSNSDPTVRTITHGVLLDQAQNECPICIEEFQSPGKYKGGNLSLSPVARLKRCGHYFHPKCILTWVKGFREHTCPVCRSRPT